MLGHLQHLCGCSNRDFNFKPRKVQKIRDVLSNKFCSGGSNKLSSVQWWDLLPCASCKTCLLRCLWLQPFTSANIVLQTGFQYTSTS